MIDQSALDAFPFISLLSESAREELSRAAVPATIDAGDFTLMEGDTCASLAIVLEGVVRVYKSGSRGREITLYRILPGESCVLTASCIMSGRPFPAFARVESAVVAIAIPASDVRRWVQGNEVWRSYVFSLVSDRLANVIEVVEEVAFGRLDRRIARYLLQSDADADSVVLTTHEHIADELGSSREVVSRILKDFENGGVVSLSRGRIRILDRATLTEKGQNPDQV